MTGTMRGNPVLLLLLYCQHGHSWQVASTPDLLPISMLGNNGMLVSPAAWAHGHTFPTALYFDRLDLSEKDLDQLPTSEKLRKLVEAHLGCIPFENTRMHGVSDDCGYCEKPVMLNVNALAEQILLQKRGGICFELNGLFAAFLQSLKYKVKLVPSVVVCYMDNSKPWNEQRRHMSLLVEDNTGRRWLTDVGLGESPLHPLLLELDLVQVTPDGMVSRLVRIANGRIQLEWYRPQEQSWEARLQWDDTITDRGTRGYHLNDFQSDLMDAYTISNTFRQKIVACRLTRQEKIILVGTKFSRIIQRFHHQQKPMVQTINLTSTTSVRQVLQKEFGIPMSETKWLMVSGTQDHTTRVRR